jgi:hypothetical protein
MSTTTPHRRAKAPPTSEQLRLAIRHMRRPHWPDSDDAVLQHPVYGPCVRALARNLSRAPFAGRPAATPAPMRLPRMTFDARSAAANDRGDA